MHHENVANRLEDLLKTSIWSTFGKSFVQKLISRGVLLGVGVGIGFKNQLAEGQQSGT